MPSPETRMKKKFLLSAFRPALLIASFFFTTALFAYEPVLADHTKIRALSDFRLTGVLELRAEKNPAAAPATRTLNHEGFIDLRVLEVVSRDTYKGESGLWLWVMTTTPMWVESGDYVKAYQKYLIFLADSTSVFDFEE